MLTHAFVLPPLFLRILTWYLTQSKWKYVEKIQLLRLKKSSFRLTKTCFFAFFLLYYRHNLDLALQPAFFLVLNSLRIVRLWNFWIDCSSLLLLLLHWYNQPFRLGVYSCKGDDRPNLAHCRRLNPTIIRRSLSARLLRIRYKFGPLVKSLHWLLRRIQI